MSSSPKPENPILISIVAATFNRPEGLRLLLDALEQQRIPDHTDVKVIIVDNSTDANQREAVQSRSRDFMLDLEYHHEATKGITFARNRALKTALENGSHYMAFVDDDETPGKDWIQTLYKVITTTRAGVVSGSVVPDYETPPAWWMDKGGFFHVTGLPEGTPLPYAHTSNAILDLEPVRKLGLVFDDRLALAGGEDTYFFALLRNAGYPSLFTEEAPVKEVIVPSRATLKWLLIRWYRTGNTDGLVKKLLTPSTKTSLSNMLGGSVRLVAGAMMSIAGIPLLLAQNVLFYKGLRISCRGLGYVASAAGLTYQEYKNHNR